MGLVSIRVYELKAAQLKRKGECVTTVNSDLSVFSTSFNSHFSRSVK